MTSSFVSPEPEVRLVNCFHRPFDNAVAAARTCYSAGGIVTAERVAGVGLDDAEAVERAQGRRDALAADIFAAGHHTVFQHAHVQYAISNVSRQFVWSFLHSHPYYNSEQVSQRYVPVTDGQFAVPDLPADARRVYQRAVATQFEGYQRLTDMLEVEASAAYFRVFPARRRNAERWRDDIRKRAMEVARYVLPVATFTYLYHTINTVTLLRYWRLCQQMDTPTEQRIVVEKMVRELVRVAGEYESLLDDPLPHEQTLEVQMLKACSGSQDARQAEVQAMKREFDREMGNRTSLLFDYKSGNERLVADAVREALGCSRSSLGDEEAIAAVLDPAANAYLGESLNLATMSKLTRALAHAGYTFKKRLSHTADSQDQRHRTTPASRPCLSATVFSEPDYITPGLVRRDDAIRAEYDRIMERTWECIGRLANMGVPAEWQAYLLPNAVTIRFTSSADLLSLWHKHTMRLCFNSQEEIWQASKEEAEQVSEINPLLGRYLLPPCSQRARTAIRPICPEGKRYCGVPVWRQQLNEYVRVI